MATVDVGCLLACLLGHIEAYTGGLNAQVGWLVGGRPAR